MIRFFRQIRQRLLTNNKFSKYLLYAVGEILLVVIGILIALQINNLNEDAKTKALELKYLVALKKEFQTLHANCSEFRDYNSAQADHSLLLLEFAKKDTTVNIHDLLWAVVHTSWQWAGNFTDNVWSELINSGNQALISNDSLKNAITEFHFDLENVRGYTGEYFYYSMRYRDLSHEILDHDLRFRTSRSGSDNMYTRDRDVPGPLIEQAKIKEVLLGNPEILQYVMDIHITREYSAGLLQELVDEANTIVIAINKEIENNVND